MKPAGTAFRTPGSTVLPSLGPRLKPGLASLSHQRTGLDTCKAGWAECLAQTASTEGIYPPPKAAAEVVGHNLPATDPMSRAGGCGGECGCGGTCGAKEKTTTGCGCQHEVDYKTPGMACGCGSHETPRMVPTWFSPIVLPLVRQVLAHGAFSTFDDGLSDGTDEDDDQDDSGTESGCGHGEG